MRNSPSPQTDPQLTTITRKYLTFFNKIAAHPALSKNPALAEVTSLCIALIEKVSHSEIENDHTNMHKLLKNCMKVIQEVFMMVIENRAISLESTTELSLRMEELRSFISSMDAHEASPDFDAFNYHLGPKKGGSFKDFLEHSRNSHIISTSPEAFDLPVQEQTMNFRKDVEKILNSTSSTLVKDHKAPKKQSPLIVPILLIFLLLSISSNIWLLVHYHYKILSTVKTTLTQ